MQDIARVAGVHQTTVSMALRNDPRLPAQTREKIKRFAEELGYRPDPMLSALNSYRAAMQRGNAVATIAFVTNMDADEFKLGHAGPAFLAGVREGANSIGCKVEQFTIGPGAANVLHLKRVLTTRSIHGVVIYMIDKADKYTPIDWSDFSVVTIESEHLGLGFYDFGNNQLVATRQAISRVYNLGYRRIGLAIGAREESSLNQAFSAGCHIEEALRPDMAAIAPFLIRLPVESGLADFAQWMRANQVEVVLSNWGIAPEIIRAVGLRIPEDVIVVSLDLFSGSETRTGMLQNHKIVGIRAVEQLGMLMRMNQHGPIEFPNHVLIESRWIQESDLLPARNWSQTATNKRARWRG